MSYFTIIKKRVKYFQLTYILFLATNIFGYNKIDTIYYNKYYKLTTKDSAIHIDYIEQKDTNVYIVVRRARMFDSFALLTIQHCKSINPKILHGEVIQFDHWTGKKLVIHNYVNNIKHGLVLGYDKKQRLNYKSYYNMGILDKSKSERFDYKDNEELDVLTTLPTGIEVSKVIDTVIIQPKFNSKYENFQDFINKNLNENLFIQNDSIYRKIIINFTITEKGLVKDLKIENENILNESEKEEILRVLNLMPKYTPAKIEGEFIPFKTSVIIKI